MLTAQYRKQTVYILKIKKEGLQHFPVPFQTWNGSIQVTRIVKYYVGHNEGWHAPGPHWHILMTGGGVRRIFFGLTFWPKGIFLGLWKTPGFFWVAKTTQGFFGVLYFSSAQINNNISAIYSFLLDQNQSWSWHVLAFQKINNKICWCKNTKGFFWVC